MKINEIKTFYRRNLPHINRIGDCFFITYRLHGSIPFIKLRELKQDYEFDKSKIIAEKNSFQNQHLYNARIKYFRAYDLLLDKILVGPTHLKYPEVAAIVNSSIHKYDGELYELLAYCIMPNHVHLLIDTRIQIDDLANMPFDQIEVEPLKDIMRKIKGSSARYANLELNKTGNFWQSESYDHYVRNEQELTRIISYILNNPVKARMVKSWEAFPHSYVHPKCAPQF